MSKKSGKKGSVKKQASQNKGRKEVKAPFKWRYLALPILVAIGGLTLLGVLVVDVDTMAGKVNQEAAQWAASYWRKPIPAQGKTPSDTTAQDGTKIQYLPAAKGLMPKDCGACHPAQYADWNESLHGHAMGPGVVGQFPSMHEASNAQCRECHAPMTEQQAYLPQGGDWVRNPRYSAKLDAAGLTCSACHLRRHRRNGPPLREGKEGVSHLFHGEPIRTEHFEASEFCKTCHQHPATSMKVNGKTVENTYQEWLDSPYPEQGKTCQSCHMPDRRHLWKGIHDKEMTLSGVTITAQSSPENPVVGSEVTAELTIENTGTGHAFPTYTTPGVFLRAAFINQEGEIVKGGYFEEKILQRRLNMSVNPWQEHFDTRLLPGESETLEFSRTVPPEAKELKIWVWVEPDHFYMGMFKGMLRNGTGFEGGMQIQQALDTTLRRRYSLFSRTYAVQGQ